MNDIDGKVSRLWSDLDETVKTNAENVTRVENKSEQTGFELAKNKKSLRLLKSKTRVLKIL